MNYRSEVSLNAYQLWVRMTISIAEWRYQSKKTLKSFSESAEYDVNIILCKVLNKDLNWCLANSEKLLPENEIIWLTEKLDELKKGAPLAYVVGGTHFFESRIIVDKNVLIPRSETEIMVETALDWISNHPKIEKIVDVGTGSGAIVLSVMKKYPNLIGFGTDTSKNALNVAQKNMKLLQIDKLFLIQMDCLSAVKTKFDVILANLPYIPKEEVKRLKVTKYEPLQALDGGKRGVEIIFKLIDQIPSCLSKPGLAILEIQYDQAMIVVEKVNQIFPESSVSILKDYAGLNRFIKIEV